MSVFNDHDSLPPVNPEEHHVACALVVSNSGCMSGEPITELNSGLAEFGKALAKNPLALRRTDATVISFNTTVNTEMGFRPAISYEAPTLNAGGLSAMNQAIHVALDALDTRKYEYRENGIMRYRPWLFLLTGNTPSDSHLESNTRARLQKAIQDKKVFYLPMAIGANADIAKLQSYYPDDAAVRPVLKADANNFIEVFNWLAASIAVVAQCNPSMATEIQTPVFPAGITVEL